MSEYGIKIINASGEVQVDSNYSNLAVWDVLPDWTIPTAPIIIKALNPVGQDSYISTPKIYAAEISVTKNGTDAWNDLQIGYSISSGAAGNYVSFSAGQTNKTCRVGFIYTTNGPQLVDITIAIECTNDGLIRVYEKNVLKATFGSYSVNDIFMIATSSGAATCYKNGVSFYSSALSNIPRLILLCCYHNGTKINNIAFSSQPSPIKTSWTLWGYLYLSYTVNSYAAAPSSTIKYLSANYGNKPAGYGLSINTPSGSVCFDSRYRYLKIIKVYNLNLPAASSILSTTINVINTANFFTAFAPDPGINFIYSGRVTRLNSTQLQIWYLEYSISITIIEAQI